jgi:hypothetical protein
VPRLAVDVGRVVRAVARPQRILVAVPVPELLAAGPTEEGADGGGTQELTAPRAVTLDVLRGTLHALTVAEQVRSVATGFVA